jgi:tetratricopeptide (TPR) repeat protein
MEPQGKEKGVPELNTQPVNKPYIKNLGPGMGEPTKADPKKALIYYNLGLQAYTKGDRQTALLHYKNAVSCEPNNATYLKKLANMYWVEHCNATAAIQLYVKVLKLDGLDVEALMACGYICMAIGKNNDAREFVNSVLTVEPCSVSAKKLLRILDDEDNVSKWITGSASY